jgi:hypothetical protein
LSDLPQVRSDFIPKKLRAASGKSFADFVLRWTFIGWLAAEAVPEKACGHENNVFGTLPLAEGLRRAYNSEKIS